ncbi:MAG: response regulator transcription factor [Bacteroidota bacterium]
MMQEKVTHSIWVIEDDPVFRESLSQLVPLGQNLELNLVTDSIERALNQYESSPKPDLILQDVGLPGMSGIEAIPRFKELFPEVKIIILTIFEDDDRVFEAITNGADGYLLKRTPGSEILKGINTMIAGGAPISPVIAKKMLHLLSGKKTRTSQLTTDLTTREKTILKYLVDGLTINMISAELHISPYTVDTHTKNIYKKLQVHSRGEVISKALKQGIV